MTISPPDPVAGPSPESSPRSGATALSQRGGEAAPQFRTTAYTPDAVTTGRTIASVLIYGVLGGLLTLVAWFILRATNLPAYSASNVTRALSTAASLVVVALVVLVVLRWVRGPGQRTRVGSVLSEAVCYLAPAGLVVTTLGIPLSATRLYLDGIQVDQGFRTQFLSRMAETAANQDMNYIDMPTYYPIGWFWLGGRLANVLNMPGWEAYQPWALVSLAAAAACLGPIWRKILGSLPVAAAIALVTTSVVLVMTPEEPYAAVVAFFVPAAVILLRRAFAGSWPATIAIAIYLGISASFYTLFTGVLALSVVILGAVTTALFKRTLVPMRQVLAMGLLSILIALPAWGPFLLELLSGAPTGASTAQHFLPPEGSVFPMPFLAFSVVGFLCLVGLVYMIVRFDDPEVRMLSLATAVFYLWALASMVATLAGTTLLGFRVETLTVLTMATAGVLAFAEMRLVGVEYFYPGRFSPTTSRRITTVFVVLLALGGLYYVQQIPAENEGHIDQAYKDTDGYGERADRFAPDAGRYYEEVDQEIQSHGYVPTETVIYTDEINFMAYRPYHGFNAFTSHYANPLGEYDSRNEALREWAHASYELEDSPEEFAALLDDARWQAPQAWVFRGSTDDLDEPWKTHMAEDIFPNQPNVRYEGLFYNPRVFDSAEWETAQVGPFVVVTRVN